MHHAGAHLGAGQRAASTDRGTTRVRTANAVAKGAAGPVKAGGVSPRVGIHALSTILQEQQILAERDVLIIYYYRQVVDYKCTKSHRNYYRPDESYLIVSDLFILHIFARAMRPAQEHPLFI